ncbi:hypothetical protein [Paenibacillus sp. Soil522]|uniref:hypothetical protein n=1 Tax=Paenibacillus sp. Soil522 TaxID=1736388 RepID=UPI0006F4183E|nr:hypothetical protein [Paenibacillus sp. Soil522]KRE44489.1 hypothetical protein ASG81_15290 [Paenibacillus sp. Soil522]
MDGQILQQILKKLDSIEGEQREMKQILGKLDSIENEQAGMSHKLQSIEDEQKDMKREQQTTNQRLRKIESLVVDIPLVRQAALETLDVSKRLESAQVSLERKVASQLHTHEFGIDILNREQLSVKTEIEKLKRK